MLLDALAFGFGLLIGAIGTMVGVGGGFLIVPVIARRPAGGGTTHRTLDDAQNVHYEWSFDMRWGLFGSVLVGVVSALFGIGGGPIQVPFLVAALNYSEHVATPSHAVLAATSLLASITHAVRGDFSADLGITVATALGAAIGAPVGARLSRFVSGPGLAAHTRCDARIHRRAAVFRSSPAYHPTGF